MDYDQEKDIFKSDGTRVAFLNANATFGARKPRAEAAKQLRQKLLKAFDNHKIRVIPREDKQGNRLALRPDIGLHYVTAENLFPKEE